MPTILRLRGYRFFFSSLDMGEPPHMHVASEKGYAKYWMDPIRLAKSRRLRDHELSAIHGILVEHRELFLEKWHEHFGD